MLKFLFGPNVIWPVTSAYHNVHTKTTRPTTYFSKNFVLFNFLFSSDHLFEYIYFYYIMLLAFEYLVVTYYVICLILNLLKKIPHSLFSFLWVYATLFIFAHIEYFLFFFFVILNLSSPFVYFSQFRVSL